MRGLLCYRKNYGQLLCFDLPRTCHHDDDSISQPAEMQSLSWFSFQTQCQQEFSRRDAKTQRFGKRSEHDPPNVFVHRLVW